MRCLFQFRVCREPGVPRPSANFRLRERTKRLSILMAAFTQDVVSRQQALALPRDQLNPGQLFFRKNISCRRKVFRVVEACGRDIDFIRTVIVLISKRAPAASAERPHRTCLGAISARTPLVEAKAGMLYCDPGDSLGTDGSPAIFTMAVCLVERFRGGAEAHPSTIATASNRAVVHLRRPRSAATLGDARLMITRKVSARV